MKPNKFDVLNNFISPVTGRILCDYNNVLVGDANGVAVPSISIPIGGLPNLTNGYIWRGNSSNRPTETDVLTNILAAQFVVNGPTSDLPNAQNLTLLAPGGITKINALGIFSIATSGVVPPQIPIFGKDYTNAGDVYVIVGVMLVPVALELSVLETKTDALVKALGALDLEVADSIVTLGGAVQGEGSLGLHGAPNIINTFFQLTDIVDTTGDTNNFYIGKNSSNGKRLLGGTPASSSPTFNPDGDASGVFDDASTTPCTQLGINGNISYDYGSGVTNQIYYVGIESNTTQDYSLVFEYCFSKKIPGNQDDTRILGGTAASSSPMYNPDGIAANAFDGDPTTACTQLGINGNISYDYGVGDSTRQLGGVPQTNTLATYDNLGGGTAANAFDGNPLTACTQTSDSGNISYDYGSGVSKIINTVGIQSNLSTKYTLLVEYSLDDNDSTRQLGGVPQTNTLATYDNLGGGTAANAFDGNPLTACTQTSDSGNISYDYGVGFTKEVSLVGIQSNVTRYYSLVVEYSADTITWVNLLTIPPQTFTVGENVIFDLPILGGGARAYRIRQIGIGADIATLDIQEIYFNIWSILYTIPPQVFLKSFNVTFDIPVPVSARLYRIRQTGIGADIATLDIQEIYFNSDVENQEIISVVGIQSNSTTPYSLVVEYSQDTITWVNLLTLPASHVYPIGENVIFDLPILSGGARAYRIRETGGAILDIQELYFNIWDPLLTMSQTYTAMSTFYFNVPTPLYARRYRIRETSGTAPLDIYKLYFNVPLDSPTGNYNVGVGTDCLILSTTGSNYNVGMGYQALASNTIGSDNIGIGYQSLYNNDTDGTNIGSDNIAVGFQSLYNNKSGYKNVAIGTEALFNNIGGENPPNDYGSNNVAIGYQALNNNTIGYYNIAIGPQSLFSNDTDGTTVGINNIAIGFQSLYDNIIGYQNIAIGNGSLLVNTANDNIAIGFEALTSNIFGSQNIAIGTYSLHNNNSDDSDSYGYDNIAIGYQSSYDNIIGIGNIAIGSDALLNNDALDPSSEFNGSIAIGVGALSSNLDGYANIALGFFSFLHFGEDFQHGSYNTMIGIFTAINQLTYNNCTFLGSYADASTDNLTNATAIGYGARVGQSNAIVLGQITDGETIDETYVGIGTTTPQAILDLTSTTSAFLPPRMSTSDKLGLTAIDGMVVYDITLGKLSYYSMVAMDWVNL